jgi:predicted dehydrogenase
MTGIHRLLLSRAALCLAALALSSSGAGADQAQPSTRPATGQATVLRVGLIGLDTSHVTAFTRLLNDPSHADHVPGARVVAAYKGGSPDIDASASRVEGFTTELRDKWQVEIVPSIAALLERVDVVLLTSVDGRVHLEQARPVIAAKKPLFVDKPMAARTADAVEMFRLAREAGTPIFSASSRRFSDDVQMLKTDARLGTIHGASTFGPASIEPHHPDLFWYGVHAVESLFELMGEGCERVTRTHTAGADVVVGLWRDGRIGVVRGLREGKTSYGQVAFGSESVGITTPDTPLPEGTRARTGYYGLLTRIVTFFQTGEAPVSANNTVESLAFMEAADLSKARGGAPVALSEVLQAR